MEKYSYKQQPEGDGTVRQEDMTAAAAAEDRQ